MAQARTADKADWSSNRAGAAVEPVLPLRPAALVAVRPQQLDGATAGHRRALPVAAGVLPDPVADRPEDLLRGVLAAGPAAVRAHPQVGGGWRDPAAPVPGQLLLPAQRATVRQRLALLDQGGAGLHDLLPAARLPDGLCDRALLADLAQPLPDADHPAVLDVVPAARLRLDRPAEDRRRDQPGADLS